VLLFKYMQKLTSVAAKYKPTATTTRSEERLLNQVTEHKKKVGRPFGWRKSKVGRPKGWRKAAVVTPKKKGKVGRPFGWRKNKSQDKKVIAVYGIKKQDPGVVTATINPGQQLPLHQQRQKQDPVVQQLKITQDYGESINTFMTKGGIQKYYFHAGGGKEVKLSSTQDQIRASHNILGYWENIPSSFLISFRFDENDVIKRVVIKEQGSNKNLIVMDNPAVVRLCWEEEPTI
jgi:hypothetical protein